MAEEDTVEVVDGIAAAEREAALERRVAELEAAIQEIERFTYTVAHDLRAPLRTVHRYADLLAIEPLAGTDPARGWLDRVRSAANRMDRLTEDLQTYTRVCRADVHPRRVSVPELAEAVLADLAPGGQRPYIDPGIPLVRADRTLLAIVLANLLGNALKFARQGVAAEVRVHTAPALAGKVRVCVSDNGIGIEPRFQERIFRIFERAHVPDAYPGTGAGLAIVSRAIERMGGKLGCESTPGVGSTFWLELPAG